MRFAAAELALVLRLFRADLGHQTKRIVLTVLAIAWGTLSIVILLSFGEGLKRARQALVSGKPGRALGIFTQIAAWWPGWLANAAAELVARMPAYRTLIPCQNDG